MSCTDARLAKVLLWLEDPLRVYFLSKVLKGLLGIAEKNHNLFVLHRIPSKGLLEIKDLKKTLRG